MAIQCFENMIFITFQKEGIHKFPAALTDAQYSNGTDYDVSFLGYPHRHMFHFKIGIEVTHNDRDIEFIQFKRWCMNLFEHGTVMLDYKSCEMLADDLAEEIHLKYPGRDIIISVFEDGENGCRKAYTPTI